MHIYSVTYADRYLFGLPLCAGVTALCGTVLAVLRQMLNDNILVRGMVRLLLYTGVSIQNPHTN